MYSVWKYEEKEVTNNKRRAVMGRAQQERDRKANAIELTDNIRRQFQAELPPMTASEFLSMAFRQRGIPCMDSFTHQVIGKFRTALGYNDRVEGHERKFLPLISFIMRGNSTDCETALKQYEGELEVIDSMSMTSAATSAKVGNELWGRWAGWILWRAAIDNGGYTDSVCMSCNMSSIMFGFSTQTKNGNLIHLAMTPATVILVSTSAKRMSSSLGVTTSPRTDGSTRLKVQPMANTNRATCLRLFGNGSMHICGSPSEIHLLVSATFSIVRKALETDPHEFLVTMRQLRSFGN
ncbi:hypothetical protein LTR57_024758 [Friedmanniomyces endolithicus]|nr:hypothetical protein LTR57_024758 [Friedmanniomyces endolithicus]